MKQKTEQSNMETHTFYCPKCGRELMVPFDTDTFYCTYCAASLQMENGTLHARLSDSEPTRQEQNPFKPTRKCIKYYLLSLAAAIVFGMLSGFLSIKLSWLAPTLFVIGILAAILLIALTIPFGSDKKSEVITAATLGLTQLILEIYLSDFFRRIISDMIHYR
jgi:hypothetical protein